MHKTILKGLGRFPVRFIVALVALVTGICFVPSRGRNTSAPMPNATVLAQDNCGGGGGGSQCDSMGISCGDYVCPCPEPPSPGWSDCYYSWNGDCYRF
jgi:hypothetical protein